MTIIITMSMTIWRDSDENVNEFVGDRDDDGDRWPMLLTIVTVIDDVK